MNGLLELYAPVVGEDVVEHLRQLAAPMRGMRVVHVNSTREGGGVAEILNRLVPLMNELGLDVSWETIEGPPDFYECTKRFHNGLQGKKVELSPALLRSYEEANRQTAKRLAGILNEAEFVFIHDPQPAPLFKLLPEHKGNWIWRCHIDLSHPHRPVWKYLRKWVEPYKASVFSLADFAQPLPHPLYLIPPSIDPLSEKNAPLEDDEINAVAKHFGISRDRPLIVQVSRFDRFKDPIGVIQAYQLAKRFIPRLQLVLAGGGASDDPEGAQVLAEVQEASKSDADIHVLLLPPDAHRTINALQRLADIVLQKSTREGFGLTVTEALWKMKPVIGGDTGGIRLQVINYHTGFLVSTPEGAALRIQYLLHKPELVRQMGAQARSFVKENFLLTRHLREYLTVMLGMLHGDEDRIELE